MQIQMQNRDEKKEINRKEELQRKKARRGGLTEKESEELNEIFAVEEAAQKRGALIHNLEERAIKYGRKRITAITKRVTSMVAELKLVERAEQVALSTSFNSRGEDAKSVANAAINEIQQELSATLTSLRNSHSKQLGEVYSKFRPQFEELELELTAEQDTVAVTTEYFKEGIQSLEIPDLEILDRGGVVEIKSGKSVEFLICPGDETKK